MYSADKTKLSFTNRDKIHPSLTKKEEKIPQYFSITGKVAAYENMNGSQSEQLLKVIFCAGACDWLAFNSRIPSHNFEFVFPLMT